MRHPDQQSGHNGSVDSIEVIVEIPKGSRNKYEYDHDRHVIRLDRRLFSATVYPADYGFIPDTLAEDGDPLDALVLVEEATFPGCLVRVRPLGVFWMTDEHGPDAKIICVHEGDPTWGGVESLDGLPGHLLDEIRHFFDVYKDLEPGKSTSTLGYGDVDAARSEIEAAFRRAREAEAPADASGASEPVAPEGPRRAGETAGTGTAVGPRP